MQKLVTDWKLYTCEPEKHRLIEAKWPGLLRGSYRPLRQHWWYLLTFKDERTKADMRTIASTCFPQSLKRFSEIEACVDREPHFEYQESKERCFLVVKDPEFPAVGLTLRGKYCPLYAVVIGESRVGVDNAPPDGQPDYLNFYLMGRPVIRAVHLGRDGLEAGPPVQGMTIVALAEGQDTAPASHTRLGDMRGDHREAPLPRIATVNVAPLTTGDPVGPRATKTVPTKPPEDPFADPPDHTFSERLVMLAAAGVSIGTLATIWFLLNHL